MINTPLGKEYGLIFENTNKNGMKELALSPDGKTIDTIIEGNFNSMIFSQRDEKLYFAQGDKINEFPNKGIAKLESEDSKYNEITDMVQDVEGTLYASTNSGKIIDSKGNVIYSTGTPISGIALKNKDLAHNEKNGQDSKFNLEGAESAIITTKKEPTILKDSGQSKLLSLNNGIYFQYKDATHHTLMKLKRDSGKNWDSSFMPWNHDYFMGGIDGVHTEKGPIIYAGRKDGQGIIEIPESSLSDQKQLLPKKAYNVESLALAPLEFIEEIKQYKTE